MFSLLSELYYFCLGRARRLLMMNSFRRFVIKCVYLSCSIVFSFVIKTIKSKCLFIEWIYGVHLFWGSRLKYIFYHLIIHSVLPIWCWYSHPIVTRKPIRIQLSWYLTRRKSLIINQYVHVYMHSYILATNSPKIWISKLISLYPALLH